MASISRGRVRRHYKFPEHCMHCRVPDALDRLHRRPPRGFHLPGKPWRYQKLLEHYTSMKPTFGGGCDILRGPFFVIDGALHRVLRCLRTRTYTRIADVDSDHIRTLLFSFIVCLSRFTPASLCLSRPLTTYDTVTLTYCYL